MSLIDTYFKKRKFLTRQFDSFILLCDFADMKTKTLIPIFATVFLLSAFCQARTYVLNFDINKTVRDSDAAAGKSQDAVLNTLVSMQFACHWAQNFPIMNRYDYLKLLEARETNPKELKILKDKRNEDLGEFVKNYKDKFPKAPKMLEDLKESAIRQPGIFNSFFEALGYMMRSELNHHVVLRSFGCEIDEVASIIEDWYEKTVGRTIKFTRAVFINDSLFLNPILDQSDPNRPVFRPGPHSVEINDPAAIQKTLTETEFLAIQDHHAPWAKAKEDWRFGKKFFFPRVDTKGEELLPIFFDDNIEGPGSSTGIVCPVRVVDGKAELID